MQTVSKYFRPFRQAAGSIKAHSRIHRNINILRTEVVRMSRRYCIYLYILNNSNVPYSLYFQKNSRDIAAFI